MATNLCNCSCDYCYSPDEKEFMSNDVLENTIKEISTKTDNPFYMWYGGEPYLAGLQFFEKAIRLQGSGQKLNLMQSNLTISNRELHQFMIGNRFVVSTSIDGPKSVHNQKRKFKSGEGNHAEIMENVRYFQGQGVNPWAICVVSEHNIQSPEEVYNFFRNNGFQVRFCPESEHKGINPDDYFGFIKQVYNIWENDGRKVNISNFNKLNKSIRTGIPQECDNMENCLENNLCIDTNGDAYPCNRFVGMPDFKLGNISEGLESIIKSEKSKELSERSRELSCNCKEKSLLYGGCMYNAEVSNGSWKTIDPYCEVTRKIIKFLRCQDE